MRNKIIAVNALIVLVVGLLAFLLVRTTLSSAITNQDKLKPDAQRDARGAAARLQMDSLGAERWLAAKASGAGIVEVARPLTTPSKDQVGLRGDNATKRAQALLDDTQGAKLFQANPPTFAALVDDQGKIIGRNGSSTQRGEDLTDNLSGLKTALTTGKSGSDIWVDKDNQYLTSYVAVRDEQQGGKIVGAAIIGRPLSDVLTRTSDPGRPLALMMATGDDIKLVAKSSASRPADEAISSGMVDAVNGSAKEGVKATLKDQGVNVTKEGNVIIATAPLPEIGVDGRRAVLVTSAPAALLDDVNGVTLPILGMTGLGLVLVIVGGWLLGNYITRPINTLEEGLLAILNGQADRRFELDHAELGGLAFRIDQLLNQLMGVEEDTSDAEGRVSTPPSAAHFTDAMSVDDKRMEGEGTLDPEAVTRLASESPTVYYARIYREYINAKKALGEPTDHITEQAFSSRIQGMEKEAAQKYGRPVRYQVQARAKEVVLLAIPLP